MKNRLLLSLLGLTLISVPGVRAEDPKPAAPAPAPADKPETELEKTMSKINKAWRPVRVAAKDGKLGPALADNVATMITCAEAAAKLTPAWEADKPAADRAKFQADYEAQMKKLIDTLGKLETALKANDTATATKLYAEVGDLRKSGHHDFKKPDEKN
jgi:hypothetical protein